MAIEYVLETIDSVSAEETLRYFAERLDARVADEGFAQRDGLHIMTSTLAADEIETTEFLLGYRDVVSTTFRFLNNTDPALEQHNLIGVVESAVAFLESDSVQRGVFSYDGERILFQRLSGGPVVFDTTWRKHVLDTAPDALDNIEGGRPHDTLLQPVLSSEDLATLKDRSESR